MANREEMLRVERERISARKQKDNVDPSPNLANNYQTDTDRAFDQQNGYAQNAQVAGGEEDQSEDEEQQYHDQRQQVLEDAFINNNRFRNSSEFTPENHLSSSSATSASATSSGVEDEYQQQNQGNSGKNGASSLIHSLQSLLPFNANITIAGKKFGAQEVAIACVLFILYALMEYFVKDKD